MTYFLQGFPFVNVTLISENKINVKTSVKRSGG